MSTIAQREIAHKLKVFAHTEQNGNIALTCRYLGIPRDTFYRWKKNYKSKGKIRLFIYVNAIDFVNYVIDKFPFRIYTVQMVFKRSGRSSSLY